MEPTGLPERADAFDPAMDIKSLGLRILFRVRRPVYFRGRRVGRGGFLRRKYRDKTPISATPAVTEKSTTFEKEIPVNELRLESG